MSAPRSPQVCVLGRAEPGSRACELAAAAAVLAAIVTLSSAAALADPAPRIPQDGPAGYSVACAIEDQPGLRSCAELPAAQACEREADLASRPSKEATGMTFVNRSQHAISVYWLDFGGNRKLYQRLPPGGRSKQNTFIGHNWLIATAEDHCIGIFKAAPQSLAFF